MLGKIDGPMTRNGNRNADAEFFERNGERAKNVGEPANFSEGHAFPSDHDDVNHDKKPEHKKHKNHKRGGFVLGSIFVPFVIFVFRSPYLIFNH